MEHQEDFEAEQRWDFLTDSFSTLQTVFLNLDLDDDLDVIDGIHPDDEDLLQALKPRRHAFKIIGFGGFARVYSADDVIFGEKVAVKVLKKRFRGRKQIRDQFAQEAKIGLEIRHRHLVQTLDLVFSQGEPCLIMEYVGGSDLAELIESDGALDPLLAAWIMRRVALGLEALQQAGYVHGDVKPGNIFVSRDGGTVKLGDFGLAAPAGDLQFNNSSSIQGTVPYLAPEVFWGEPPTFRSDVYSLACTLFFLIAGRTPHSGTSPAAYRKIHLQGVSPCLNELQKFCPAGQGPLAQLAGIVERGLAKDPEARFAGAAEFARALHPIACGRI